MKIIGIKSPVFERVTLTQLACLSCHQLGSKEITVWSICFLNLKEMVEILYQYESDYVFDSSDIENEFGLSPTSYADGLQQIIDIEHSDK